MGCHNSSQLNSIKHILRNIENYAEGAVMKASNSFPCKELQPCGGGQMSKEVMRVWHGSPGIVQGGRKRRSAEGGAQGGQFPGFLPLHLLICF